MKQLSYLFAIGVSVITALLVTGAPAQAVEQSCIGTEVCYTETTNVSASTVTGSVDFYHPNPNAVGRWEIYVNDKYICGGSMPISGNARPISCNVPAGEIFLGSDLPVNQETFKSGIHHLTLNL